MRGRGPGRRRDARTRAAGLWTARFRPDQQPTAAGLAGLFAGLRPTLQ